MRLLLFANNRLGLEIVRWLVARNEPPAGLVVHPPSKRRFTEPILEAAGLPPERVFDGSTLRRAATFDAVRALEPDMGLSVLFDYILEPRLLELFPGGAYNLHPSWLPFNRGRWPNVWSIVERTPAGVTLHAMDAGVDTGPIVARRCVEVEPVDTGLTLYRKLEQAALALFCETWPALRDGRAGREPQDPRAGSVHRLRDVERIDRIDLDRPTTARELIDLLRARTFPPYPGAWFEADDGRRVQVRVELEYADGR